MVRSRWHWHQVTIYMTTEQKEQLDRLVSFLGCSPAETIRTAVRFQAINVANLSSGLPGRPSGR